ncbi:MAG: ribosomal-protein-alanine N-acetyltransferase [Saprospiraceae bacterium]|jgi:ribosomal-protein-alanine N-acetyltransferase|tara:strand:+ start:1449 stop:1997 length:549 start_codon:yes stop_codon:yes gene_type:complete
MNLRPEGPIPKMSKGLIKTERLFLTPMALQDAPFVLKLLNTKEWLENIGQRNVHTIGDAEQYIQKKMILHFEKNGYGNYLMTRIDDGVKVGCVSLYNREDVEGVDIGFAMLPQYVRKGYAYEGSIAIMSLAKDEFDLASVCAFTSKDNLASQKLIERLGMKFEKTILFGEEKEELLYYKLDY